MGDLILCTGRGGTGKSTFVALASRYLDSPKLLVDLDPDESLGDMLGIDLAAKGKKTISAMLHEFIEHKAGRSGYDLFSELQSRISSDCLYRDAGLDFISLGTKFAVGCYCAPDAVLKDFMSTVVKDYEEVIIDSPAGLEHFNRKIVVDIDDLFVILDPSEKSVKHIERVLDIVKELKVNYHHLYLVGNYKFTEEAEEYLRSTGESYLGRMEYDSEVKEYNLKGRPLLGLPENSPALQSVREILAKAGLIHEGAG
jgi:CO dehydrogenase maturation factor